MATPLRELHMSSEHDSSSMTEESLRLLGAGTPYRQNSPTRVMPQGNNPPDTTYSNLEGPWEQRHPQGNWK